VIQDRTPPRLELGFLNRRGEVVTSTESGRRVTTKITVTDVYDPEPVVESTAMPVFSVHDGEKIVIRNGRLNAVKLPTTAIDLSATAHDASGNSVTGMAVLSITN